VRMMRTATSPRLAMRILEKRRLSLAVFVIISGG
jgi:hypothetical protein